MALTKATQNVITPNIVTTDTTQTITGIKTISVNSASTALTITQTGSGEAFRVEDSASPDATPFKISSTGAVTAGNRISGTSAANGTRLIVGGLMTYNFSNNFTDPNTAIPYDISAIDCQPYKVYVNVSVFATYLDSTPNVISGGGYEGAININSTTNSSGGVGYTINGALTAVNMTTVLGSEPTVGGVPTGKYAGFTATAASGATNGTLGLVLRGHTAANTANITYVSSVTVTLIAAY